MKTLSLAAVCAAIVLACSSAFAQQSSPSDVAAPQPEPAVEGTIIEAGPSCANCNQGVISGTIVSSGCATCVTCPTRPTPIRDALVSLRSTRSTCCECATPASACSTCDTSCGTCAQVSYAAPVVSGCSTCGTTAACGSCVQGGCAAPIVTGCSTCATPQASCCPTQRPRLLASLGSRMQSRRCCR